MIRSVDMGWLPSAVNQCGKVRLAHAKCCVFRRDSCPSAVEMVQDDGCRGGSAVIVCRNQRGHDVRRQVWQPSRANLNRLPLNSSVQKAAELSGVAGGFCCLSLHRSQISEDL